MTYYAFARRPDGKITQLIVRREHGRQIAQEWTGVTYKDEREATRDVERLNCGEKS